MVNIADSLTEAVSTTPERTALICKAGSGFKKWSFNEIEQNSRFYAHFLAGHVVKGERVMLMVKPSMEFVCLSFALFSIGAVVILVDPGMGYRNLLRCIGSVRPSVFIGIAKAQFFRLIFRRHFTTVRTSLWVGGVMLGLLGRRLPDPSGPSLPRYENESIKADDLAAIIFTTGSTGPPKGVRYEHRVFQAQLGVIRDHYGIASGDIDQPAFPLFALFSIALGACAVIPDMDPTQPAKVDPEKFIETITAHGVTYSFGSPAIWNVISRYCQARNIRLPSLKKVLMAGAPVPGDLIKRMHGIMAVDGEVHIPYGATESLPIVSITGHEVLSETWQLTREGKGACVGRPLPGIEVRVIAVSGERVASDDMHSLPTCEIGEIIVRGEVVTRAYDNNEKENNSAKIIDGDSFWHRLGDTGYFDTVGRLWFCGRKAHMVETSYGPLYTICCEAVFNNHPQVTRAALVGVGRVGDQLPVLIVELNSTGVDEAQLFAELRQLALSQQHTSTILTFMVHDGFPVDIRHNAKIFREKLAVWAEGRVKSEP